ncbi:hypothetical protein LTR09_000041 [Extremus antarcticus]|uniref:JmjC domain-containing protein n=1 Tax=Extremus antarcticus TaxID=702011 RepID=A0AAJ0GIW3_9PEZI|nr:hypothetical protein LTR09_000041 [Extremus antarcticus]
MPVTRSKTVTPAVSHSSRKRKAESISSDEIVVKHLKRRRVGEPTIASDQQWLKKAMEEFRSLKYPKLTDRYYKVELAKRYLPLFKRPTGDDAYFFDDPDKARRFLAESNVFDVPMFVRDGANYSVVDPESTTRPIEQMFDILLANPDETLEYDDEALPTADQFVKNRMGDVAKRFKQNESWVKFPLNFPDIPTHTLDHAVPSFIRTPACTVLHDLFRAQLDVNEEHVCDCLEPNIPNCGHEITRNEFFKLTTAWVYWQGTTMISEPGTITPPHWDKYGMPTHISCLEGEIGFAWLVRPTHGEHIRWACDEKNPTGPWAFKVLRAGDSLCMPSGTVHFVFRRPAGKQTLGFAGHVIRKQDLAAWSKTLDLELSIDAVDLNGENEAERHSEKSPHQLIVPPLMRQVRKLIKAVRSQGLESKFGGKKRLTEALKLVSKIEKKMVELDFRA